MEQYLGARPAADPVAAKGRSVLTSPELLHRLLLSLSHRCTSIATSASYACFLYIVFFVLQFHKVVEQNDLK